MTTPEQPAWQIPYAAGPAREAEGSVAAIRLARMVLYFILQVEKLLQVSDAFQDGLEVSLLG